MDSSRTRSDSRTFARLWHALGPILGGLALDLVDLATLGALGLYVGFPLGAGVAWWLSGLYRIETRVRATLAVLTGIYCMIPTTHFLPLATVVGALGRFFEDPVEAQEEGDDTATA